MGKLVLTRHAGESVIVREANGREWLLAVIQLPHSLSRKTYLSVGTEGRPIKSTHLHAGESMSFAGGSLELRPARCPSQAILAFDFPRDVTILRTEIA